MSKKIDWAISARKSYLAVLEDLINKGASKAAQKIDEELVKKLKILSKYPFIGSITQKRDARKLILAKHYWVIYKEHDNSIIIAAIIDTRSNHIY